MTENSIGEWTNQVHRGDSLDVITELPTDSVHAIITDPPYGLGFMGRSWDEFEPREYQEWIEEWSREALRVICPGGHALVFSGNRTHHRAMTGLEDAGWTIRDTLTWHYGGGFPKALDVSKAIDKQADADRQVVETKYKPNPASRDKYGDYGDDNIVKRTAPATDAAEEWQGWRTHLKPSTEFVALCRAPLAEGTVAENVLEWGCGALNIDDCRIGTDPEGGHWPGSDTEYQGRNALEDSIKGFDHNNDGRYPANTVFDEHAAQQLDGQTGDLEPPGGPGQQEEYSEGGACYGEGLGTEQGRVYPEGEGGASRFFYTSKASRRERTMDGAIENPHPTVKPIDLMEWLIKLTTRQNQVVLDPFAGSGTTGRAAKNQDRRFILIEQNPKWCDVARARSGLTPNDPSYLRGDDAQTGLSEIAATDGGGDS